ncbi:hypothetical protein LguiB_005745 [Lonicera macranthoides]
MLDIPLASTKKRVLRVDILLEFSEFISLRKWNSSALPAQTATNLGICTTAQGNDQLGGLLHDST